MSQPYIEDPLPELLRVVVPNPHDLFAGDTRVIVIGVELWSQEVVINLVIPHMPADGEPQIDQTINFRISDDLGTDYQHPIWGGSGSGPGGSMKWTVGARQAIAPGATELYVPWSDGTKLTIPIPPAD